MGADKVDVSVPTPSARRLVEAAAWRVRLADAPDDADFLEFERWLAADAESAAAWRQVDEAWQLFGEHAASPELIEARKNALSRAQRTSRKRWGAGTIGGLGRPAWGIAAGIVAVIAVTFLTWQYTRFDVYETGPSERNTIRLADGSTVTLDAQSELRVRYTRSARVLTLLHGQAQFDVARDAQRPFTVTAQHRRVIATGTSFNVDMLEANLFVTLIEGRVVIVPTAVAPGTPGSGAERAASERDARIELTAGQQAAIPALGPPVISQANVSWATAWQTGRVIFEDEPLGNAIARLNRYSDRTLIVEDERTASRRISGVFRIGDVDGFVDTVISYLPVSAKRRGNGDIALTELPASM